MAARRPRSQGSTGMFAYWISYGIQDVTDGTSNTILFAESLVGDSGGGTSTSYLNRNNAITGVSGASAAEAYDASSLSYQDVILPAINLCASTKANATRQNITTDNGNRWAWGAVGMTLFNTVVTPNGAPFNDCRDSCGWLQP